MKAPFLQKTGIIFLLILSACSTKKARATAENADQLLPVKTNEILFVNLKMDINNASEKSITLINYIKSNGKLKNTGNTFLPGNNGTYLTCSLLNSNKKKIEERMIEHPLIHSAESYEANGSIKQNAITQSSAEFSLRIQNDYDVNYIVIREVINGKATKTPFTISLKSK